LITRDYAAVATMRWTGMVSTNWKDPNNWVEIITPAVGRSYEAPAGGAPTACVDVIIAATTTNYPELIDSVSIRDIKLEDRAMLKNPHIMNYRNAAVELKLKPAERDRFIMWSAPLGDMYSGDYHYRSAANQPQWGDVNMNFFQQANPDYSGSIAARNSFTATFGSVNQALELGRAFNLRVVTTTQTRDSVLRFPRVEDSYTDAANVPHPLYNRSNKARFITQGVTQGANRRFNLPVYSGMGSSYDNAGWTLVQVVNPYLAYLRVDSFLNNNPLLASGYYIWEGDVNAGFATVSVSPDGNRYVYTEPSRSVTPNLIAPLQSFFVAKNTPAANLASVVMSPNWTTTSPSSYSLRATQVLKGGVLYVKVSQGNKSGTAALVYDMNARPELGKEDLSVLIYDEIPLTVYSLTAMRQPLAINVSNNFQAVETDLGLRVKDGGETKLEFSGLKDFGFDVVLIDKLLNNKRIDLSKTPEYTFTVAKSTTAAATEINDRFSLSMSFTGNGVVVDNEAVKAPVLYVSADGGYINIQSKGMEINSLQVYNLVGALVYSSNLRSAQFRIPAGGLQTYIVKARIGDEYHIQKVYVK
jgi:hypothetical protein